MAGADFEVASMLADAHGFSNPAGEFADLGARQVFAHVDLRFGEELWASASESGPATMITDLLPGPDSSDINSLVSLGNNSYFTARTTNENGSIERRLFRSDGTREGTQVIFDRPVGSQDLAVFQDQILFTVPNAFPNPPSIWISDGTRDGARQLTLANGSLDGQKNGTPFVVAEDRFYFSNRSSNDDILFTSDGTPEGTSALALPEGWTTPYEQIETAMKLGDDHLLFVHRGCCDYDIVKVNSDGTTVAFSHSLNLELSSRFRYYQQVGGNLFFFDSASNLWQTNGTLAGTRKLTGSSVLPENTTVDWTSLYSSGEQLVFQLRRDFTPRIASLNVRTGELFEFEDASLTIGATTTLNGKFYYSTGLAIIVLDFETGKWTEVVRTEASEGVSELFTFHDQILYLSKTIVYEHWFETIGEPVTLVKILDHDGSSRTLGQIPRTPDDILRIRVANNGQTLIATRGAFNVAEVFRLNSPHAQLSRVAETQSDSFLAEADRRRYNFTLLDDKTFAFTSGPSSSRQRSVWISDGTELGTRMVFSLDQMPSGTRPNSGASIDDVYAINGKVVFSTNLLDEDSTYSYSRWLWVADGKNTPRAIYRPGDGYGYLFDILGSVNDRLVFVTQSIVDPRRQTVWATNAKTHGIESLLEDVEVASRIDSLDVQEDRSVVADERLFFRVAQKRPLVNTQIRDTANDALEDDRLWFQSDDPSLYETDGTGLGTRKVAKPFDLCSEFCRPDVEVQAGVARIHFESKPSLAMLPGSIDFVSIPDQIGVNFEFVGRLGDSFIATDHTQLVAWNAVQDSVELLYASDSYISGMLVSGEKLFFIDHHGERQLYVSDGTTDGTAVSEFSIPSGQLAIGIHAAGASQVVVQFDDEVWITDGKLLNSELLGVVKRAPPFIYDNGFDTRVFASDVMYRGVLLPRGVSRYQTDDSTSLVSLSGDESGVELQTDNEIASVWTDSVAELVTGEQVDLVSIDIDALAKSPTRLLNLELGPDATLRLHNGNGTTVVVSNQKDRLFLQFAGIEIDVKFTGRLNLIDELGTSRRRILAAIGDDELRFSFYENQHVLSLSHDDTTVRITLPEPADFTDNELRIDLLAGTDEVLIDDTFRLANLSQSLSIEIHDDINGSDQVALTLPTEYRISKYGGTLYFSDPSSQRLSLRLSIANNEYQNPQNRFDVNLDGEVSSLDALNIVNALAHQSFGFTIASSSTMPDVSGDGKLSAIDALQVINRIRQERITLPIDDEIFGEDEDFHPHQDQITTLF
nr:dockerin type I domain-containing protein [Rubripirellula amarantea]